MFHVKKPLSIRICFSNNQDYRRFNSAGLHFRLLLLIGRDCSVWFQISKALGSVSQYQGYIEQLSQISNGGLFEFRKKIMP